MQSNFQDTKSIEDIIKMIDDNKLLLPEFQRDFKWPIEKSETLFDSIFQDLFIGSLIVSRPKFDLACKGFDLRERGKSSRKPIPKLYTEQDFEQNDIYTLLDGQQRTTSIYRALKGKDIIHIIFKDIDTLISPDFYDYEKEEIEVNYEKYIEGFDSSKPKNGEFHIAINDLYKSIDYRESKFLKQFIDPLLEDYNISETNKEILREYAASLHKDFRSDIIKKSNLLSVQLLNMDLEKFCLYFERSNSQGLNLSFTDIITAKVYIDFKLSRRIKEAKENQYFNDKLVDSIVRYINFIANGDVTKKSILKELKGSHFIEYWDYVIKDICHIQEWLEENNWLFKVEKIPYKTMLLPILCFYQNLPNKEFSQANQKQLDLLKFWFFTSIIDNRYGGARHGSTNVVLKKDLEIMKNLANNIYPQKEYWMNLRVETSFNELLNLDNNNSAKTLGLSYYMWYKKRFLNLENSAKVSINKNIDVHHIFPSNYLKKKYGDISNEFDFSDSMLNKIRINKISNIKISDKSPNKYLKELDSIPLNNLKDSLDSHHIGNSQKLIDGDYDDNYILFLEDRYKEIQPLFNELSNASNKLNSGNDDNIWV